MAALTNVGQIIANAEARRAQDAESFLAADNDLCMLCWAYGSDKRSLYMECFYDIKEVVPEALETSDVPADQTRYQGPSYLRICKTCRAELLTKMREWRDAAVARRGQPKDHDGYAMDGDPERNIPLRVNGATIMLTREEWDARARSRVK